MNPSENVAVAHNSPDLAISWPLPVAFVSAQDARAPGWAEVLTRLP